MFFSQKTNAACSGGVSYTETTANCKQVTSIPFATFECETGTISHYEPCSAAAGCLASYATNNQYCVINADKTECRVESIFEEFLNTSACTNTICGDGACNGGEDCSNCPSDCTTGCAGCGDGICDAPGGENECNCGADCPGVCSGSCTGDYGCQAVGNCGEVGGDPASGSCPAGQLCCKSRSTGGSVVCNCCYDPDWVNSVYPPFTSCNTLIANGGPDLWPQGGMAGLLNQCAHCPCTETCSGPSCGQDNGCGGSCSNADNGAPACATLSTVTPYLNPATGMVTITWTDDNKAEQYNVIVYPRGTAAACPPINPNANCSSGQASQSFSFFPNPSIGNEYSVSIQGINLTCGIDSNANCFTDFTVYAPIEVEFHEDLTGSCSVSNPVIPGTVAASFQGSITTSDGIGFNNTDSIDASTETIYAPYWPSVGNYNVTLNPGRDQADSVDWSCVCPRDCQISGVSAPDGPLRYYVSKLDLSHRGWFQAIGGNLYSARVWPGSAIIDPVPVSSCDPDINCQSNAILKDLDIRDFSAGYAITGGGSIDSSDEDGEQRGYITQRAEQTHVMGNSLDKITENYHFFANQYKLGLNPADSSTDFGSPSSSATKPAVTRDYYYVPGNFTINSPWVVSSGESYVIFVGGNLILEDNADHLSLIDVAEGGFLAFIVSGDINISSSVGNNNDLTSTASNIEGIFVADGQINSASKGEAAGGDERLVAEGIFVGWNGINLNRDFSDGALRKAENNNKAAELFIYRPDLLVNAPETMAKPRLLWQESN